MVEAFHVGVEPVGGVGGRRQLGEQVLGYMAVVLVVDLVLEARPEIHGDGAQLHLDGHGLRARRQEDRHLDDEMQAAIPVRLRVRDVVLLLEQRDVVLREQQVADAVDVMRERTDDADVGDVRDARPDVVEVVAVAFAGLAQQ